MTGMLSPLAAAAAAILRGEAERAPAAWKPMRDNRAE